MAIKKRPQAVPHMFMPGQTVTAAIKKFNLHDVTKEEMVELLTQYKSINPRQNPKPGQKVLIPILERHQAQVFNREGTH
jgi:hypothetical protein